MEISTEEVLLICRGCLSIDGLFNINNTGLLSEYSYLLGSQISPNSNLPQYLCYICSALLYKFSKFRDKCLNSKCILENVQRKFNIFTTDQLKQLNTASNSYYKLTKPELNEYHPENRLQTNTHIMLENENHITIPVNIDNKTETIIKEDIDEKAIKTEHVFSNLNDQYDSDQSLVGDCTDNVKEFYESDEQALITIKSSIKSKSTSKRKTRRQEAALDKSADNAINSQKEEKITDKARNIQKYKKRFETKENLADFEMLYNVEIIILDKEEQLKDVLDRKSGVNYLQSPYKCDFCFKGFMDEDNLNKHHMAQHDENRGSIVCEFCKFRYKDMRGLNQHLKKHRLKFVCRQCKYVSRTTFNAKEHHKVHSGKIHACEQCGKSYEKLSSHLSHMRIHHPSEMVWCEYCGESFIGQFGLNAHKKRAHREMKFPPEANCIQCNMTFTNVEALNVHRNRQTDDVCGISCVHCGTDFHDKLDLKRHLLDVHRRKKKYCCEKCSKTFSKESLYSAHYRRKHVDKQLKNSNKITYWICEVCGKSLPSKCLLVYHQRNHTGETPYQCTECPKSFTMNKRLQSHMRVHTSARPYSCKLCPKAFKGLSALRSHENVHSGATEKTVSKNKCL